MTFRPTAAALVLAMTLATAHAATQTPVTAIETQYLTTLFAPLNPPQAINPGLLIFHPRDGGTLSGRVNGKITTPGGDWVRVMPDGNMRIDVRLSVILDDESILYMTFGGVLRKPDEASWRSFLEGTEIRAPSWYYVITPNFETSSKRYAWLNGVQAIGKLVSIQTGKNAHVQFDIYGVN